MAKKRPTGLAPTTELQPPVKFVPPPKITMVPVPPRKRSSEPYVRSFSEDDARGLHVLVSVSAPPPGERGSTERDARRPLASNSRV
jgi:hypothetical protein